MGILKLIKEEIGYAIYYAIPYADLDIFGILAGTTPFKEVFSFLEHLPFVNGIDFWRLSTLQKIIFIPLILVPYIDLELLKLGRIHRWFLGSRSKRIRIATKNATKQAQRIKEFVDTANAFGISEKEMRNILASELSDMADSRREQLIQEAMTDGGQPTGGNYSGSRGNSRGRAMTDGGQPNGGGNRRNPPQGGNGLRGYSDIETGDSGGSINWKGYLKKAGIAAAGLGIIALIGFIAMQVLSLGLGVGGIGLGFVSGALGGLLSFVTNIWFIGAIILPIVVIATFKLGGAEAGKFLVLGLIGLLLLGAAISFSIGGNPLAYIGYGEQVADSQAGLLFGEVEGAARVYGQAKARVFCLLKGPSCLRQWRLNNTERPGSEDVGETYGLKIDRFEVGQGEQLDIAYQDSNRAIPVSFTLSNPRRGLKGIDAEDVSYRLRIVDSDKGKNDPYCDTGWIQVQEAYEINDKGGENDIYPGTAASTGFLTLNEDYFAENSDHISAADNGGEPEPLTLENCEMLQPALGQNRVALLNVKYDYFSQATLDFKAMSRDYFQSNEKIEKSIKESKTADTPVKAAINVNSPVLFNTQDSSAQPFAVKATLNTDKRDIQYQVDDFKIRNSRYVEKAPGVSCQFTDPDEGMMELEPDSVNNLIDTDPTDPDEPRDSSYYWFDVESNPPIFGCVMQLEKEELGGISPSGETLTMRVKTNYTVSKRDSLGSFEVYNSICSRVDCPLIVTTEANASEDYNFKTKCSGLDAGNGCSIVEPSDSGWEEVGGENPILNRDSPDGDGADTNIEKGEIAVRINYGGGGDNDLESGDYYGGLKKRKFKEIADSINDGTFSQSEDDDWNGEKIGVLHYTDNDGEQEMEIVELDETKDGGCEYQSSYPDSGLIWSSCGFGTSYNPEAGDSGTERASILDVMRMMGPITVQ